MTAGERLRKLLKDQGISQTEFAARLNTSIQNVASMFKQSNPRLETVMSWADAMGVDVKFLLYDNFESEAKILYAPEEMEDQPSIRNHSGAEFQEISEGMYTMTVPLVTQPAYGGYLAGWWDPSYVDELPRHTIVVTKLHKGFYLAYTMRGSSMDYDGRDSISEGNIVTGRRIEKHYWSSKFHTNSFPFYIIHHKDGIIVKEIVDHDTENGTITLHSLNPDKEMYPDFKMSLSEVEQIFNVVQVTKIYKS